MTTNREFLGAFFSGAMSWVCHYQHDPDEKRPGQWTGAPLLNGADVEWPRDNTYFSIMSVRDPKAGRADANFNALHVVMIDDVGTKVTRDKLPNIPPTWELRTSRKTDGTLNFQYGYALDVPCTDQPRAKRLIDHLTACGYSDKGAGGVNRYARLPVGSNTKGGKVLSHDLFSFDPSIRYSIAQLEEAFGVNTRDGAPSDNRPRSGIEHDPILRALDERGMVKKKLADGKWDITCPWVDEHTKALDDGTAYFEANHNGFKGATFKCLHSHGADLTVKDVREFLGLGAPASFDSVMALEGAVLLPSDFVPFTDAAAQIFPRFAERRELFIRAGGGVVVELTQRGGAAELAVLPPAAFRSRLEKLGPTYRHYRDKGKLKLGLARCSMDSAAALLATREAAKLLPPIRAVVNAPVLTLVDGAPKVLGPGYNPEAGGVLVLGDKMPEDVPLAEAVAALRALHRDFDYVSRGDEARALAAVITPALAIGGLLQGGPFPIEIAESDKSQTGKGYRMKKVCAIYGERPYLIGQRTGGVGSLDESVSAGLLSGRPFLRCDNLRGRIESAFVEMIITAGGDTVNVRVPHRGEVPVDASGVLFQFTSNGIETTPDLANRSSIVRIRKRPPGYGWHKWPEGDLLAHVAARQPFYLGCVHAVVRAWFAAGRSRKEDTAHDLRAWAGALDWIVQELFNAAPLMQGHRVVQERVADRALIWLRSIALAVVQAGRSGQPQTASAIWELGDLEGIELPGAKRELDEVRGRQRVGQLLGRVFRESNKIDLDGMQVERIEDQHYDEAQSKEVTRRVYIFGGSDDPGF